ncbi:MAG: acyl carrier protein [Dehalococcoidia bacterium]|nr:acyl carrier protein [Dehalococcoidia bacterium]
MSKLFDKIKNILVDELGVDSASIVPAASFIDDLNMDPDDLAEFFTTIEDSFSKPGNKFEIPEKDADNLVTVQDIIDYLQEAGVED